MGIVKPQQAPAPGDEGRRRTRDVAGLLAGLGDPDPAVRRWAARDLGSEAQAAAALVELLFKESDSSVREAVLLALTQIGDATAVAGLTNCLRSDDVALRNEAIESLKLMPDAVAPVMHELLTDSDADVRIFAVNVLESLRHPDVEQWLCGVLERDEHVNVCATAVDLLGEVGSSRAVAALQLVKQRFDGEPYIAFAADLALKRIEES